MKVLLDTCVLSELRHPKGLKQVRKSVEEFEDKSLFISVISIGEIIKGISLLNEGKRKRELQVWIRILEVHYADRILPIDAETTHIWGEITARAQRIGKEIHASDGLIASTAIKHGLHIMTRNITDFEITGVLLINPWEKIN